MADEFTTHELEKLIAACERDLGDYSLWSAPQGYPGSLALCVIDAVFSVGVKYQGVVNLVSRYRSYRVGQAGNADVDGGLELMGTFEHLGGPEGWAANLKNEQRTSKKSGILKADAVLREAHRLARHGVWTVSDLRVAQHDGRLPEVKTSWCEIPGQRSGISWSDFLMLAGVLPEDRHLSCGGLETSPQPPLTINTDHAVAGVKPDRMIKGYVANAISVGESDLTDRKAAALVKAAAEAGGWDATTIDHEIWRCQSGMPHGDSSED